MTRGRLRPGLGWLLLPAILFLAVFFGYPLMKLFVLSFTPPGWSLANYRRILSAGVYLRVLVNTIEIAFGVAVTCVVLAYPLAYLLSTLRDRTRNVLLVAVAVPFFTSVLVRSYVWMVLLGQEGVINKLLIRLGLIRTPLRLIYNTTGLLISMTHILLPTAVLLLLSVMRGIDMRLVRVSASLGASRMQTFLRIYWPLTLPGVGAAGMLVFIFAMGNYVTAALLGGTRDTMLAMVIAQQVDEVLNWSFAGALAAVLTGTTVVLFFLFNKTLDLDRMWGGDAVRGGSRRPRPAGRWRSRAVQALLSGVDVVQSAASRAMGVVRWPASRFDGASALLWVASGLVLLFLLLPILLIIPISFTSSPYLSFPPDGFSLRWYRDLVDDDEWGASALLSVRVGLSCMLASLALGVPAALALVRRSIPAKGAVYAFIISPLIIPSVTIAVSVYYFFAPLHLVGGAAGLVLAHTIGGVPLVTVIVAAALRGFDRSLESASLSMGAGVMRTFTRITLPIIRPAILAAAFFAFMHSFDEVVIATFIGGVSAETLPKKMWEGVSLEIRPTLAALSALLIGFTAMTLLLAEFLQRRRLS